MAKTADTNKKGSKKAKKQNLISDSINVLQSPEGPVLAVSRKDQALSFTPLSTDILTELIPALNNLYIISDETPTTWVVRYPETEDSAPVLSFVREQKIVGSLALTQETLEQLYPIVNRAYIKPVKDTTPFAVKAKRWFKKHKVLAVLAALIILPVLASTLYGIVTQLSIQF